MSGPEVLIPIAFFATILSIVFGVPIVRAKAKRIERGLDRPQVPHEVAERLERMEQAIDAIAVEVERISEGQRFATKLLVERPAEPAPERGS